MGAMTTISLPKKLAVSMGIELTFLPNINEYLFTEYGVAPRDSYAEGVMREFYAEAMKKIMDRKGIDYFKCHTDPGCIEVPTNPKKTSNALMKSVRQIYSVARELDLSPRAKYINAGGGAHIHTGIPENVNDDTYKAMATAFLAYNPWIAWAFADKTDARNALAVSRRGVLGNRNDIETLELKLANLSANMEHITGQIEAYTNILHTKQVWGNERRRSTYNAYLQGYQRDKAEEKIRIAKLKKQIENLHNDPASMVEIESLRCTRNKCYAMSVRSYTIEFRCFLMTEYTTGLRKYIAFANAVVKQVTKWVESGITHVPSDIGYTEKELKAMKYSEAKRGFNNMLITLGLPPEAYRAECVNMALRIRYLRTQQ